MATVYVKRIEGDPTPVVMRRTPFTVRTRADGSFKWFSGESWKRERQDATLRTLDRVASKPVAPRGVAIRRAGQVVAVVRVTR